MKNFKRLLSLTLGVVLVSSAISSIVSAYDANMASTTFIMPDHAVTLKAISQANTYTIVFDKNGGAGSMSDLAMTYDTAKTLTTNAFTKTGYSFVGRSTNSSATTAEYTDGQSVNNLTSTNGGIVTLFAIWAPKGDVTYKVHHYIKKVGVNEYEENSVDTYNTGIADGQLILADFAKTDIPCMTYTGGSLTMSTGGLANAVTTTTVLPDGSRYIYLYYSRNVHTLTLTKDTGISTVATQGEYECGATVNINATPDTGYHFYQREIVSPIGWTPSL